MECEKKRNRINHGFAEGELGDLFSSKHVSFILACKNTRAGPNGPARVYKSFSFLFELVTNLNS